MYFKEKAIKMAWKLITEVYSIPKDRLFVTYFAGCEEDGIGPDLETREAWRSEEKVKCFKIFY